MASSASGQDEPNHAMWLATRAGKMEPSCPFRTTRCILQAKFHQKPYNKSFTDQVCSVKMAGYWPRSFLRVYGPHKHTKKELGQYPAIFTSHLVNNPYLFATLAVIVDWMHCKNSDVMALFCLGEGTCFLVSLSSQRLTFTFWSKMHSYQQNPCH